MTCRRICRELLWQARFGELGPGSAPHLEHLTDCRSCRDELGFDRALVRQLRTALAARIEGAVPSPQAWQGVLARMSRPEPRPSRLRAWSTLLVARLRVGSAMAGATLAVVMALNVEIVPVRPSDAVSSGSVVSDGAPPRPLTLADGFSQGAFTNSYAGEPAGGKERTASRGPVVVGDVPEPEQLPLAGVQLQPREGVSDEPALVAPAPESSQVWQPPTIRLVPADAAAMRAASGEPSEPPPAEEPAPTPPVSEAPS